MCIRVTMCLCVWWTRKGKRLAGDTNLQGFELSYEYSGFAFATMKIRLAWSSKQRRWTTMRMVRRKRDREWEMGREKEREKTSSLFVSSLCPSSLYCDRTPIRSMTIRPRRELSRGTNRFPSAYTVLRSLASTLSINWNQRRFSPLLPLLSFSLSVSL